MGLLDQGKMLLQAKKVQKELKNTEVEARSNDGLITVVVNGEMHIKKVEVSDNFKDTDKRTMEQAIQRTVSEALSRAQAVAAEKTKSMMKDMGMNLPGM